MLRSSVTSVFLVAAVLLGPVAPASAATDPDEVRSKVEAVPGVSFHREIREDVPAGFRLLVFGYRQPVDHKNPGKGSFDQRFLLLHRGFDRPMVSETDGYTLTEKAYRLEPTRLLDGNQVTFEHRYFTPSRPDPVDWSKLDIWQAATDHHRLITALRKVYDRKWITTGISKGGMAAVYHRRFYPGDVDGTAPYVAPNDVKDSDDSAYAEFFEKAGTPECRKRVRDFQRELLRRRVEIVAGLQKDAEANQYTYRAVGSLDHGLEMQAIELEWGLWQNGQVTHGCDKVPAVDTPTEKIVEYLLTDWYTAVAYSDQGLAYTQPYFYQSGTQLGWATSPVSHLKDLLRYPYRGARDYLPAEIRTEFQPGTMKDIDSWVRARGSRLLFVYGQNDPWSQEAFVLGKGTRESKVFVAKEASHEASIAGLTAAEQRTATAMLRGWAGLGATRSAGERTTVITGFDGAKPVRSGPFPR